MKSRNIQLVILLLCVTTFFVHNGSLPLDIMESRNLVTAREMVTDGHWLVPTMNGELRLEKPPFPTWVAGAIEAVVPHHIPLQRAAAGVMGLLWTWFVWLCARYLFRRSDLAWLSVLVFLTCYQVLYMGRTVTWDIYCHAFMMGSIYCLLRLFYDESPSHPWRWSIGAGLLMGLSFLSKGPISFYALLLPFLLTVPLWKRPHLSGKGLPMMLMILLAVIVGGWWYLYLFFRISDDFMQVMGQESTAWINHNVRSWIYYIQSFIEVDVWVFWLLAALCFPYWKRRLAHSREYLFLLAWSMGILLLLSFFPEKKIRYLLPFMAPCALLVTSLLAHFIHSDELNRGERIFFRINGYLIALIMILSPLIFYFFGLKRGLISWPLCLAFSIVFVALGGWLCRSVAQLSCKRYLLSVAVLFIVVEVFLWPALSELWNSPSYHSIENVAQTPSFQGLRMYHPSDEPIAIQVVYAAGQKVTPLDISDETAFKRSLPMLLVSQRPAREVLSPTLLPQLQVVEVDVCNENRIPLGSRRYHPEFINHVTFIRSIEQ